MATTEAPNAAGPPPSLDNLPFEIQRLILSQAPTLDTLRAIVHASPRLHGVYAQDRLLILRAFVEKGLDGILFDAHAAYLSGTNEFQQTRDEPMLWDFLHNYEQRRTRIFASHLAAQLAFDDLVHLARFTAPSSNLLPSAWEVEEILCVNKFGKDMYGGVFDRVAWDLDEERNPRYRHQDSECEDLKLFSGPRAWRINGQSRESMLRHGLSVLSAVLKMADHDELVRLVRESITSVQGHGGYFDWIDEAVRGTYQDDRRQRWYSEHAAAQDRREKTPFDKDTLNLPPLAWVTFWKGEASNYFGSYVPNTFRRWGFVMWDATRLEASGVLEYMELEAGWIAGDPREEDYLTGLEDSESETGSVDA